MSPTLRAALCLALELCLATRTPHIQAQTTPTTPETTLTTQLVGKQFVLRDFTAATDINGTWDGNAATLDPPKWHILTLLTVHKVKLKGDTVKIEATRNQIMRDKTGKLGLNTPSKPVDLTLTLQGDPAVLAATLRNAIFFPNLNAAIAAIPKPFQNAIPPQIDAPPYPRQNHSPTCDCAGPHGACTAVKDTGIQPPRTLHYVQPQFSDEARQNRFSGHAKIGIQVDDTGAIADEWILRELPYGLDEQAALAVSQYKFAPATCHNHPVSSVIFVEVNFQTN